MRTSPSWAHVGVLLALAGGSTSLIRAHEPARAAPPVPGGLESSVVCLPAGPAIPSGLYLSERRGSSGGNLYHVDTTNGQAMYLGVFSDGVRTFDGYDIAFTTDGLLYGTSSGELYCVDATDAAAAGIGAHGATTSMSGLTGGPRGTLFGIDGPLGGSSLYAIDRDTGSATLLGPLNGCGPSSGDLAYRPSDGTLYATLFCDPFATLVVLDPASGSVIATVGPVRNAAGVPLEIIDGLAFDTCDHLYAGSYDATGGGETLHEIDPATGRSLRDVPMLRVPPTRSLTPHGLAAFLDRGCCFARAQPPAAACAGATVAIDGTDSGGCGGSAQEYRWSAGATVACDWSPSPLCNVQPSGPTSYTLETRCVDPAPICTAMTSVSVDVLPTPQPALDPVGPLCVGRDVRLDASASAPAGCPVPLEYEFREGAVVLRPWSPVPTYGPFPAVASATYTVEVRCPQAPGCAASTSRFVQVDICTLAVEFESFEARATAHGGVEVRWRTTFETDTSGFAVERSASAAAGAFVEQGRVDARGAGAPYVFRDAAGSAGSWYRVVEYTSAGRGAVAGPFAARSERMPVSVSGTRRRGSPDRSR